MRIPAYYELDDARRARLDQISTGVISCFAAGGYRRIALPVLQPADLYLDMAGEEVRERMFVFEDPLGAEMCLRADLTIPMCRGVLDSKAPLPSRVACLGPVYRFQNGSGAPNEMIQAGLECLGVADAALADSEVFGLTRDAVASGFDGALDIEIGDVGLFNHLLAALELPDVWMRRLKYAFRHPSLLHPTLDSLRSGAAAGPATVLSYDEAERRVREKLASADIIAGRTVAEIAFGLVAKSQVAAAAKPPIETIDLIERYLRIAEPIESAIPALRALCSAPAYVQALLRIERVVSNARNRATPEDAFTLSTTLGRSFVYYTGFVFSMRARTVSEPFAAGGRYDQLMSDLGSPLSVPAVGCAVWPERLLAADHG